ncbi:MAG: glyoxalase [Blastococcus sp.]|nr:glyoxalase [Blastococcus sp.]
MVGCADVEAVATFWSKLLARPVVARIGPYIWLKRREGVGLGFHSVPAHKLGTSSIHLDLGAENPAAEQARIEALGGRRVDGYEDGGFSRHGRPGGKPVLRYPGYPGRAV